MSLETAYTHTETDMREEVQYKIFTVELMI